MYLRHIVKTVWHKKSSLESFELSWEDLVFKPFSH